MTIAIAFRLAIGEWTFYPIADNSRHNNRSGIVLPKRLSSNDLPCPSMTTSRAGSTDWQRQLAIALDPLQSSTGKVFNAGVAVLVVVFAAIFVAETYQLPDLVLQWLDRLDTAILVLFSCEYGLRFLAAENKRHYVFSLYSAIDLLAILPLWLGVLDVRFIRFVRLVEGFRVLRLARFFGDIPTGNGDRHEDRVIIARIIFTLFSIIFVYSGLIFEMEHSVSPNEFRTFLDAFYFSVVTMTTVGFGDVTPVSDGGRLFTVLMILTGIALIPWQLSDLIQRILKSRAPVETTCSGCGLAFHEADAAFCRRCGVQLTQASE